MKTAGLVLDFYDDPQGSVLKAVYPTADELPEVVKAAHILSADEREVLRDEAYALVATNEGKVLRKFACVDAGNTLLSALYFEKVAHLLPEDAQEKVATVIRRRMEEFGLVEQEKTAAAKGANRTRDPMRQPYVSDDADWAQRTNLISPQGTDNSRVLDVASTLKTASVDLTDHEPIVFEEREVVKTAMADGRYPLDSYSDVLQAVTYFDENWTQMDPADRREFCAKTAARAEELGIYTPELLARYGSPGYAEDVEAHLASRRAHAPREFHGHYSELQTKQAELAPEVFAGVLAEIDKLAGVDALYGGEVADPFYSTFGVQPAPKRKVAGVEVSDDALVALAERDGLNGVFDFAPDFNKDPVAIFESLPDDSKTLIARLATE